MNIKMDNTMKNPRPKMKGIPAIIAGACAGATEITVTYPFESAKTRSQLGNRVAGGSRPFAKSWTGLYDGYTAAVSGSMVKTAVQFSSYYAFASAFSGPDGRLSSTQSMACGFAAGVTEAVVAVTPFECVKTKIIHARKVQDTRMSTVSGAVLSILRDRGPRGFFTAVVPTTLRQSINASIKFSTYHKLTEIAKSRYDQEGKGLSTLVSSLIGSATGFVSAFSTQPLDVIKTRMQSIHASQVYGSTLRCIQILLRQEGPLVFWSGIWHRLGRLSIASAIMFPVYENTYNALTRNRTLRPRSTLY